MILVQSVRRHLSKGILESLERVRTVQRAIPELVLFLSKLAIALQTSTLTRECGLVVFSLGREFLNTLDVLGEGVGQLLTVLHVTDGSQLDLRERFLHLIRGRLQLSVIRVSHLNTLIIVQGALLHERVPCERVTSRLAKPVQLLRIGERIPYR